MSDAKTLYDEDFLAWSIQQAEVLRGAARTGSNQHLDWENLAEEIESLGISQRSELKSQLRRVIEHLLRLEYSPAREPRRGWVESISDARVEIEAVIEDSPSLRGEIDAAIGAELKRGSRKAIAELEKYGEVDAATAARMRTRAYTPEQILEDWFPPEPEHPKSGEGGHNKIGGDRRQGATYIIGLAPG